jgi:adenylate cyclase
MVMALGGYSERAMKNLNMALRLSPNDPLNFQTFTGLAFAHFAARRYAEAIEWARRALEERPGFATGLRVLAASYGQVGRIEEARSAFEEMMRLHSFSASTFRSALGAADPEFLERYLDGLRKAGLRE